MQDNKDTGGLDSVQKQHPKSLFIYTEITGKETFSQRKWKTIFTAWETLTDPGPLALNELLYIQLYSLILHCIDVF